MISQALIDKAKSLKPGEWLPLTSFEYDEYVRQTKYAPNTLPKANETQIAGDHYKQFKGHEPWDVITAWNLGYLDGTALKYIARWKHKGGIEDLKKAIHFLQKTIEVEEEKVKNGLSGGS